MAWWSWGPGDVRSPQNLGPPPKKKKKKSHHVDDAGSSPVRAKIVTGYPTTKSKYKLKILLGGPLAVGFRRRTLAYKTGTFPESYHVDDAGSSPVEPK